MTASRTAPVLSGSTVPPPEVDEDDDVVGSSIPESCSVALRETDSLAKKSKEESLKVVENLAEAKKAGAEELPRSTWYSVVLTRTTEFTVPFGAPACCSMGPKSMANEPVENSEKSCWKY
jgi:hypothetical protein